MRLDNDPISATAPDPAMATRRIQEIDKDLLSCCSAKERAGLLLNKATLLQVLDRMSDAREALRLALEQAPHDSDTRLVFDYLQGLFCFHEGDASKAYLLLTEVLSNHAELLGKPDYRLVCEDIQQRRAFALFTLGDYTSAIPLLEKTLSFELTEQARSIALAYLGSSYASVKRFEAARKYLELAIQRGNLGQQEGTVHFDLALTYACLHFLQDSKNQLELCVERAVEYRLPLEKLHRWLSRVCKGLGQESESERYARLARPN